MMKYIFCCLRRRMPESLKFRGMYPLVVNAQVDEPSNIKWENLDVKLCNINNKNEKLFIK